MRSSNQKSKSGHAWWRQQRSLWIRATVSAPILVAGSGRLARVVVDELLQKGAEVIVIAEAGSRTDGLRDLGLRGARIVEGSRRAAGDLGDVSLSEAGA